MIRTLALALLLLLAQSSETATPPNAAGNVPCSIQESWSQLCPSLHLEEP
jgi:hypothetical protein